MSGHTGLVHLYTGDGKGKTTCAVGLCVRALGHGCGVLFCQFLKSRPTGELEPLGRLGAEVLRAGHPGKFTFQMTPQELDAAANGCRECLAQVQERLTRGGVDLLVLDEVVDAVNCSLVDLQALTELIRMRPAGVELVLTGRDPAPELVALADYHTHFACQAHPYHLGICAREGIEY